MASPSFFGSAPTTQTTEGGAGSTLPTITLPPAFQEQLISPKKHASSSINNSGSVGVCDETKRNVTTEDADVCIAFRRLSSLVAETSHLLEKFHQTTTSSHASLAKQTNDTIASIESTVDRLGEAKDALVLGVRDELRHNLTSLVPLMTTLVVQLEKWNDGIRSLETMRTNHEILACAVSSLQQTLRDQEDEHQRRMEVHHEQHEQILQALINQNRILEVVMARRMCHAETQTLRIAVKDSVTEMSPPPVTEMSPPPVIDVEKENDMNNNDSVINCKKERVLIEWKDVDVADLNLDHGILERLKKKQKTNA